jgi:hypothetical protein
VRRVLLAGVLALTTSTVAEAVQQPERSALVLFVHGASIPQLLQLSDLRSLAASGGAALMNGRTDARDAVRGLVDARDERGAVVSTADFRGTEELRVYLEAHPVLRGLPGDVLLMIVAVSPSAPAAAEGDELGTVIAAWGDPGELLEAEGDPKALTSDSTRRAGVVATVDPAATVAAWLGLPYDAGAPIRATTEPAPLDLYRRYLQQRRLAVPVAATSWTLLAIAAIAGMLILRARDRVPPSTLTVAAALSATFPWLALALLLVGHLPDLTVPAVALFVPAVVAAGTAFTAWAYARWGTFRAVAATGAAILGILAIEALLGWPAAVTPLAGGGQLDGGRFFGMPNAEVGLVLGSALYVAHRLGAAPGAVLLGACAIVAGSPWTGSNLGAAIALSAAAGLWLSVRDGRPWWLAGGITAASAIAGAAVTALLHRLTDRPTHITAAVEGGGPAEAVDRVVDRLGIGLRLIADSPFALVPVVGTLVLLPIVLRPPRAVAAAFGRSDAWRDAIFVLVLGSIVAYLVEDTGAAALGFGFVLALSGLVAVSAITAREKMT